MPAKGRKGITIYEETFELFNRFYEEHREELRARNIASVSSLIIECAINGLDKLRDMLEGEKKAKAAKS
ncbi:MAG: hypothetical protein QXN08_08970 [Nitrososphaerales archaeon]